jgi:hypothetical protein
MTLHRRPCSLTPLLLLGAGPVLAQEMTGTLEGRMLDLPGPPPAEVRVSVTGPALQGTRGALANSGLFVLLALPVGEY